MPRTVHQFIPPNTKSNADKKQCCCDWGLRCCQLSTFFDRKKHPLGGFVNLHYSQTCGFQNVLDFVVSAFSVPQCQQDEWKNQYQAWKDDPENNTRPRVRVAKLHYPIELVTRDKGDRSSLSWTSPITAEQAEWLQCYKERSTPAYLDDLLKFNPSLGTGQSKCNIKKFEGYTLLRIAPCASVEQVNKLAADLQQQHSDQSNLINIGKTALRYLGQEEIVAEEPAQGLVYNQPERKKQKTNFSTEVNALDDAEFVRQVAIEFDRRGYVFGLNLRAKDEVRVAAVSSASETAPTSLLSLPLNMQFHPSTTQPTPSESRHWSYMYSQLEKFYGRHGHCNVPISDKELHDWTKAQRSQWNDMKKGGVIHYMSLDRIQKLMELEFDTENLKK